MKRKHITALQTDILLRALGEKGFESLYEQYHAAHKHTRQSTPPHANQIRIASLAKKVGIKEAATQLHIEVTVVDYAVRRVARYKYLYEEIK